MEPAAIVRLQVVGAEELILMLQTVGQAQHQQIQELAQYMVKVLPYNLKQLKLLYT